MTNKKIGQLLDGYETKLLKIRDSHPSGREPWFGYQQVPGTEKMEHALEMIPKMRKFLKEGRKEKVFRWLGFLQCVFWMVDIYTVEQLANHSRPTKEDVKSQYPSHSFDNSCSKCTRGFIAKLKAKLGAGSLGTPMKPCRYSELYNESPETSFPIT